MEPRTTQTTLKKKENKKAEKFQCVQWLKISGVVEAMKKITSADLKYLDEAVVQFKKAQKAVALTGAGISVESGIDDFRSPGGIWSRFPPEEYGTITAFQRHPEKSWKLFRALGKGLVGKKPNAAHLVLANLEKMGLLHGVVTQNIDNLHQDSGSRTVMEIHGNHRQLQCLGCGDISEPPEALLQESSLPRCRICDHIVKPNVVLFGENVRSYEKINDLLHHCDLLMVIGTSAQVYPAASLPEQVKLSGGSIYEFNVEETSLTRGEGSGMRSDYFFEGRASTLLRYFLERLEVQGTH